MWCRDVAYSAYHIDFIVIMVGISKYYVVSKRGQDPGFECRGIGDLHTTVP